MADLRTQIRRRYDLFAPLHVLFSMQHMHHGLWESDSDRATPEQAQDRLLDELYAMAGRPQRPRVFDVGCGFGASMMWLARAADASGQGITLSGMQAWVGRRRIRRAGLAERVSIVVADAELPWPAGEGGIDLVLSIESAEYLMDRAGLFQKAFGVLAPGGALCIAVAVTGEGQAPDGIALRRRIETGMLLQPFSSLEDYRQWCHEAGFEAATCRIVTPQVIRSWGEHPTPRIRPALRWLVPLFGNGFRQTLEAMTVMPLAYRSGALDYALIVARKPTSS